MEVKGSEQDSTRTFEKTADLSELPEAWRRLYEELKQVFADGKR